MTNNLITRYCTAHIGSKKSLQMNESEHVGYFNNDNALSKSDIYNFKFMYPWVQICKNKFHYKYQCK